MVLSTYLTILTYGEIYCKWNLYTTGVVETSNALTIKATAANSETKIAIFGGSSVGNYWILGQNSFGVGADNLVFGNSVSGVVLQLNQNRDISIPKKLTVGQHAVITTLEVYQTSHLKNTEIDGTLKINNVNTDTLYQTRAWISIRVFYSTFTNSISSVIQSGRVSASVSIASNGFSITFASHPSGSSYIPDLSLPETYVFVYYTSRTSTSMSIIITNSLTDTIFRKFVVMIPNH